jgi:hypothetical protein
MFNSCIERERERKKSISRSERNRYKNPNILNLQQNKKNIRGTIASNILSKPCINERYLQQKSSEYLFIS